MYFKSEKYKNKLNYMMFSLCAEIIEDEVWIASCTANKLMKINTSTGMVDIVCELPDSNRGNFLFSEIYYYKGKIYMIPLMATAIWVYNIRKEEYFKVELRLTEKEKLHSEKFRKSLLVGEVLYLFGYDLDYIASYNIETEEFRYIWNKTIPLKITDVAIWEKNVFCTFRDDNKILSIDIENGDTKAVVVENNVKGGFGTITVSDKYAYLSNYLDEEVIWNIVAQKKESVIQMNQLNKKEGGYRKCLLSEKGRIYFPMYESKIVRIVDGTATRLYTNEKLMNDYLYGSYMYGYFILHESGFWFCDRTGKLFYFDSQQYSILQNELILKDTDKKELLKQIKWDDIQYESREKSLIEFIACQIFED